MPHRGFSAGRRRAGRILRLSWAATTAIPEAPSIHFARSKRARDAVRAINADMTSDITIYLRGGTHARTDTFTLGAQDSGSNGYNVIYRAFPGETAVVSGGRVISGWIRRGDVWQAEAGPSVETRQLYVNGVRAIRARSAGGLRDAQPTTTGYTTSDADIQNWRNIQDVEIVINSLWKQFRCGIQSIAGTTVTLKQPCWDNVNSHYALNGSETTRIENAYELLDTPGEWYVNRATGRVYYKPRAGEDMTTAHVVMPVVETLLRVSGSPDMPVHHVHFLGITFSYAGWTRPNDADGFAEVQANWHLRGVGGIGGVAWTRISANVVVDHSRNVRFERNIFAHLGAAGLSLGAGSRDNAVVGNTFTDISGTALMLGDVNNAKTTDPSATPAGNRLENNYIHHVGVEYQGGVGIWIGYAQNTLVAHNELHDLPYTAISIGWGWGEEDPSIAQDNHVVANRIYDHVTTLIDGGGIYSLSAQPGNVYSGNVIQQQHRDYGAIYLDNKSRYITVHDNVLLGNKRTALIKSGPFGGDHYIHDNWWQDRYAEDIWYYYSASEGDYIPTTPGPNTIENNHVIAQLSDAPASIISNAGIQSAYADIRGNDPPPPATSPASPAAPVEPSNLQAICGVPGRVTVSWPAVKTAASYRLRIDDESDANGTQLDVEITTPAYAHAIAPGISYRFWVSAKSTAGESAVSSSLAFSCEAPAASTATDADGDGKADVAIFRPADGTWFLRHSATNDATHTVQQWGLRSDIAVSGDYDGDDRMDLAVYRPSTGDWHILQSSTASIAMFNLGASGDLPVPGDYDGDGKNDLIVYRPVGGVWRIRVSSDNYAGVLTFQWGLYGDIPVAGDYDGDRRATSRCTGLGPARGTF